MKIEPFEHKAKCTLGEIAMHNTRLNIYGHLVFPVNGVKVGRSMFTREHADHDPQESG